MISFWPRYSIALIYAVPGAICLERCWIVFLNDHLRGALELTGKDYYQKTKGGLTPDDICVREYTQKSRAEKITYWCRGLHEAMRHQGEYWGRDEMTLFTPEEYAEWKKQEPEIDLLLPDIFKQLNIDYKKVAELLGIES